MTITGESAARVLAGLADEVVAAAARAREILVGEKEKTVLESVLSGYVAFHLISPRYKLHDILGDDL